MLSFEFLLLQELIAGLLILELPLAGDELSLESLQNHGVCFLIEGANILQCALGSQFRIFWRTIEEMLLQIRLLHG